MRIVVVALVAGLLAGCGSPEDRSPFVLWKVTYFGNNKGVAEWQPVDTFEGRTKCEAEMARLQAIAAWSYQCWPPGVTPK
jgi:hypothetical protein